MSTLNKINNWYIYISDGRELKKSRVETENRDRESRPNRESRPRIETENRDRTENRESRPRVQKLGKSRLGNRDQVSNITNACTFLFCHTPPIYSQDIISISP